MTDFYRNKGPSSLRRSHVPRQRSGRAYLEIQCDGPTHDAGRVGQGERTHDARAIGLSSASVSLARPTAPTRSGDGCRFHQMIGNIDTAR